MLVSVVLWIASADPADACMHPPRETSDEKMVQSEQSALVYYAEGRQHLFLRSGFDSTRELPEFGWVVPVPSVPDDASAANAALFGELQNWMSLRAEYSVIRRTEQSRSSGPGGSDSTNKSNALTVHATMNAGPYEITPLEATGKAGLRALKTWLKEHDYRVPESTEPAAYYVQNDWTFLAVRVRPPEGRDNMPSNGTLRPLHLSFETDRIVYPLKFETNQGVFSVTLYVVTHGTLPPEVFRGARARGFFVAGVENPGGGDAEDEEEAESDGEERGAGRSVQHKVRREIRYGGKFKTHEPPDPEPRRYPPERRVLEVLTRGESGRDESRSDREETGEFVLDPLSPTGQFREALTEKPEVTFDPIRVKPAEVDSLADAAGEAIDLDYPSDARFLVDHRTIDHGDAPEPVVSALDEIGAWRGKQRLQVRVLHAPAVNADVAEPDLWQNDFAIPRVGSDRNLGDHLPDPPSRLYGWLACGQTGASSAPPTMWLLFVAVGLVGVRVGSSLGERNG